MAALVCGGVGCAAALSLGVMRNHQKNQKRQIVEDCQAAFPTAQLVAAMRALDARSPLPRIGSNIGAGPDVAAETLAGELGFEFLNAFGNNAEGLVQRTMFFDEKIMDMLDSGCRQFVILAAGLDARAWRLPRLSKAVKVFEVDVPRAMAYKAEKIAELGLELPCTRVVVEADLSNQSWTSKLIESGFDPEQTSFFLIEGLLMYLPPNAPQALLKSVSSLMTRGSKIAGDSFVNFLWMIPSNPVLEKYGTKWTFEARSNEELVQMLEHVSLNDVEVLPVGKADDHARKCNVDQSEVDAEKCAKALGAIGSWPPAALDWLRGVMAQKGGAAKVVREIVEDRSGFHGLKDTSPEHKARVCERLLQDGWEARLEAIVRDLPAGPERSRFRKCYDLMMLAFAMMRMKYSAHGASSGYVLYTASKV